MNKDRIPLRRQLSRPEILFCFCIFALFFADHLIADLNLSQVSVKGWLAILFDEVILVSVALTPFIILGRRIRYLYFVLWPIMVVAFATSYFYKMTFGAQLGGEWIGIVLSSSFEEVKWFLSSLIGIKCILAILVVVAVSAFGVWLIWSSSMVWRGGVRVFAVILSIAVFSWRMSWKGSHWFFRMQPSLYLFTDGFRNFSFYRKLANMKVNPILPSDLTAVWDGVGDSCIGLFVLGESSTRNHWSLYGYHRRTTPCLDALRDELMVFDDVIASAGNTAKAMELMLTSATLDFPLDFRYSFSQALKSAGFRVLLFSNQRRFGFWDSVEEYAFSGCDPLVFMSEQNLSQPFYDDVLLNYLGAEFDDSIKPSVVFVHLMGSHYPTERQYPHNDMPFPIGDQVGSYDNSIYFTDMILGKMIDSLKAKGVAWLIYISDHGETPSAKSWRLSTEMDLWEIPMVVWVSEEYKAKFPETYALLKASVHKPLQADGLMPGLLHISGVRGGDVSTEKDFLDDSFVPRLPRLISCGEIVYSKDMK